MWAGAAGIHIEFPEYRGLGQGYMPSGVQFVEFLSTTEKTAVELIAAGRRFMILGTTITLLLSYWMARKIIGFLPAVIGFFLIALAPFYIGLSNILHLDGLLTGLMLVSFTALFLYLWKEQKPIYFLISAAAAAGSWLTKTPGIFMFPLVGLLLLIKQLEQKQGFLNRFLPKIALPLTLWTLLAIIVFVILWPAMWVDPIHTIQDIVGDMGHYISGNAASFLEQGEQTDAGLNWGFYPTTILWRNTPVILIGLIFTIIGIILRWETLGQDITRRFSLSLFLFAFFFILTMTLGVYKGDRYVLPIYPPLILLSALGWVAISRKIQSWLKEWKTPPIAKYVQAVILVGVVCLQLVEVVRTHPYYNTYYNPLLGGPNKASEVLVFGWGEGLDQVAAYLNTKPDAGGLTIMSAMAYGPLSFYFSGTTLQLPRKDLSPEFLSELDYVVIYIFQWQQQLHKPLIEALGNSEPEHVVTINGLEYAWIYNVTGIPSDEWEHLLHLQD
jgi:4-amino-4-deoxy-L-arabinose transferase-like glycosyltransferase